MTRGLSETVRNCVIYSNPTKLQQCINSVHLTVAICDTSKCTVVMDTLQHVDTHNFCATVSNNNAISHTHYSGNRKRNNWTQLQCNYQKRIQHN